LAGRIFLELFYGGDGLWAVVPGCGLWENAIRLEHGLQVADADGIGGAGVQRDGKSKSKKKKKLQVSKLQVINYLLLSVKAVKMFASLRNLLVTELISKATVLKKKKLKRRKMSLSKKSLLIQKKQLMHLKLRKEITN
jgi:hypothetical protein